MNNQKNPPKFVEKLLRKHDIDYDIIDYFAYPQAFNSIAGNRGAGGNAMSKYTMEAWVCDGVGPVVYICNGMYHLSTRKFEMFRNINNWESINVQD